jgi:hypothetical protein
LGKIKKGIKKRRISHWFQIVEKVLKKMNMKKVISQTNFMNISKSELLLMFIKSVLLITFFVFIVLTLIQRIWNLCEIMHFLKSFLIFSKKICLVSHFLFFFIAKMILNVVFGGCMQIAYILQRSCQNSSITMSYILLLCRWLQLAQLAKGKKSRL